MKPPSGGFLSELEYLKTRNTDNTIFILFAYNEIMIKFVEELFYFYPEKFGYIPESIDEVYLIGEFNEWGKDIKNLRVSNSQWTKQADG